VLLLARGQSPQVLQNCFPPGETVSADLARDARGQYLLCPAPPDPQRVLQNGAVHPGIGKGAKLLEDLF
jgi:hypothetical protein